MRSPGTALSPLGATAVKRRPCLTLAWKSGTFADTPDRGEAGREAVSVMQQARISRGLVACVGAASLLVGTTAASQESPIGPCRSLAQLGAAQIVDYNDPASSARIKVVEDYHFNDDVRALRKGQSSSVPADLDFVLRPIPNTTTPCSPWVACRSPIGCHRRTTS